MHPNHIRRLLDSENSEIHPHNLHNLSQTAQPPHGIAGICSEVVVGGGGVTGESALCPISAQLGALECANSFPQSNVARRPA